jgi:hypothetical protein
MNHEIEAVQRRLEGETLSVLPRSLLQPPRHDQHRHHDEEGVVDLWTMGFWQ